MKKNREISFKIRAYDCRKKKEAFKDMLISYRYFAVQSECTRILGRPTFPSWHSFFHYSSLHLQVKSKFSNFWRIKCLPFGKIPRYHRDLWEMCKIKQSFWTLFNSTNSMIYQIKVVVKSTVYLVLPLCLSPLVQRLCRKNFFAAVTFDKATWDAKHNTDGTFRQCFFSKVFPS